MNTWLTDDTEARKNRLLKALQTAHDEEEVYISGLVWIPTEALSGLHLCMNVKQLWIEGQFEERTAGVRALAQSV